MGFLNDLSSVLGESDSLSNKERAKRIVKNFDKHEVRELVARLDYQNKGIQSDSIKVLYEIGYLKPEMLLDYTSNFLTLLDHKNNRMIWGGMIALSTISSLDVKKIYPHLSKITRIAEKGTVITKDAAVTIVINLAKLDEHYEECFPLYLSMLKQSANNQFPMYAEKGISLISTFNKDQFIEIIQLRLQNLEKESQKKRLLKLLSKLGKT
jgi:hypothetical protein